MKNLKFLLKGIIDVDEQHDLLISGLSIDSREIKPGDVFFAYKGYEEDGRDHIEDAIKSGASVVILEAESSRHIEDKTIPIIPVRELQTKVGIIASRFYDNPSHDMTVIGITGTNGKTSCCHFLAEILQLSGEQVGVIGTLGSTLGEVQCKGCNTTPNPIAIQHTLFEFKKSGVKFVVMEVSSHGIDQGRHAGIQFDTAIFTNLSRDHLDYHNTMEEYAHVKRKLFQSPKLKKAIFNIDDPFGRSLATEFYSSLDVYGYSAIGKVIDLDIPLVSASKVHSTIDSLTAALQTPWGSGLLHANVVGRFNLSNLLAVLASMCIMGYHFEQTLEFIGQLHKIPGRMELFGGKDKPYIVVDYAHTPDALGQVLDVLREYTQGNLWCVFGCGGHRDIGKRSLMGRIAETKADHVVLTDDNPRDERPYDIIAEIEEGMEQPESAIIEHDRARAIAHAITCAQPEDIVLIAGKGHEAYQAIGDEKREFSDILEVKMILEELWPSETKDA